VLSVFIQVEPIHLLLILVFPPNSVQVITHLTVFMGLFGFAKGQGLIQHKYSISIQAEQ